jgi:acid phosphatase (class A)
MKRIFSLALLSSSVFVASAIISTARADESLYVDPQTVPLNVLLAPPPADGSARQQADMAAVLRVQNARTADEVTRAKADTVKSVFRFADVLGPAFNEQNLPKTTALFKAASHNAEVIAKSGKHYFKRARPAIASSDVHPVVQGKGTDMYDSYPSGHATFGYMSAILLAEMVPEKREAIFARGREFGENRVVDGVHYPSDVEAGRIDGTLVAAALMANPDFQKAFAAAKAEVRAALSLD